MTGWKVLVVSLYLVTLIVLAGPLLMICGNTGRQSVEVYGEWSFWAFCALFALGQGMLLFVPVPNRAGRPVPRRPIILSIIVSGFFFALIVLGILISLLCAIWGDNMPGPLFFLALGIAVLGWLLWGMAFLAYSRSAQPEALVSRLMSRLLRGSILELLVAIPSHVIVRQRKDCCAPGVTALGIATGLAIMLLSFGPGVFFLFAKRMRQLQGSKTAGSPGPGSAT